MIKAPFYSTQQGKGVALLPSPFPVESVQGEQFDDLMGQQKIKRTSRQNHDLSLLRPRISLIVSASEFSGFFNRISEIRALARHRIEIDDPSDIEHNGTLWYPLPGRPIIVARVESFHIE